MTPRDATYTVTWARREFPDDEQVCTGLTPRTAMARLIGLLRHHECIVLRVEREQT